MTGWLLLSRPDKQRYLMSWRASQMAALNPPVDVSRFECFDSIPNLMTSGPARSATKINRDDLTEWKKGLTVDTIAILVCRSKPVQQANHQQDEPNETPLSLCSP